MGRLSFAPLLFGGSPLFGGGKVMRGDRELLLLANGAPEPLVLIDPSGTILRATGAIERVLGFTPESLRGTPARQLVSPESRPEFDKLLKEVVTLGGRGRADLRGLRKDGSDFAAGVRVQCVESGGTRFVVADLRDISERMSLMEAMTERATEYARASRDLQQFAYAASHDLQEPLRMVASYTQLLSKRYTGKIDKDADEFLAFAHEGAVRMGRLLDDLLAFSRIDSRAAPFQKVLSEKPFADALANLRVAMVESGAQVTHDPLPTLEADASQLLQLFQNLIGNALKFRGSEPPKVHVGAVKDGALWKFSVRDNGIGIAPEYHEKIFVIFQRLHLRTEYPGNGIGLAVCRRIVERHGGHLWVESRGVPGEGSTFWFTLPESQASRRMPVAARPTTVVNPEAMRTAEDLIAERLGELV